MRRNVKKALCAAVTAASLALSSCGLEFETIEESHRQIYLPQVIYFSWWGNEIRSDYTVQGMKEYEKAEQQVDIRPLISDYTGYKENLDALITCRKEPDLMTIDSAWLTEYSPDGAGFCDLNEFSDIIDLANFSEQELACGTVNGRLNALPVSLNAMSFYYNKKLLDDHGLTVPETWDDLFDCAKELSKYDIYVLESSNRHYLKMLTAHEEQLSGKKSFGDQGFDASNVVSMMYFYKKLIDSKVIPMSEFEKSDFLDKKSAGEMMWVSDAQYYVSPLEEKGGEVVVGKYPQMESSKRFGWYLKPTSLYAISKHSENQRETARFLDYLVNSSRMAELQGIEKGVPLSRSALETLSGKGMLTGVPYQASRMIEDNTEQLELMPSQLEELDRVNCFFEYFDLYYYGRLSIEEAAYSFTRKYPFTETAEAQ